MDEPLSNLDAKLRVEMRAYIARLHQELGTTTLYVTHDQTEAMTMGDRVAVMRDGRLEQVDAPQAALRPPGQPVRRRLHRLAGDEPRARARRARRRRARTWSLGAQRLRLPGRAPRRRARPRRRAGRGRDPPRGAVPRARRARRRAGPRGDRRARRVAGLRPAGPRRRRRSGGAHRGPARSRARGWRRPGCRPRARSLHRAPAARRAGRGGRPRCACTWTRSTCTSSTPTRRSP